MALYEFPRALLRAKSDSWNLAGTAVSGGAAVAGTGTLLRSDGGGYWTCKMSDVSLSGRSGLLVPDQGKDRQRKSTLLWRAVRQVAAGGVNQLIVPRNDALYRPWPKGVSMTIDDVEHSDSTLFDDDTGYYQPVIDIETASDALLRDVSLDVVIKYAGEILGGESFSINHPTWGYRLYEIGTVDVVSDTEATITFNPPLREDVDAGTRLDFDRPRCTMRLGGPSSMDFSQQPWTFNTASVDFVEAPIT